MAHHTAAVRHVPDPHWSDPAVAALDGGAEWRRSVASFSDV